MLKRTLWLLAIVGFLPGTPALAQTSSFQVVVNAANPVASLSAGEVGRLFQKRVTRWENGAPVVPVDLAVNAPARTAFTRSVFGKPVAAIKRHWQKQIFSGQGVPPVEKASESEVLDFVGANSNAIGYVSGRVSLPGTVKVLRVEGG